MLKIINSYYYYIYNNINNNIKRVKTIFKTGPMVFVAHLFVTRLVRQLSVKVGETYHYQKKNILALDFVFVSCYNTNFNNNIGGIYANS